MTDAVCNENSRVYRLLSVTSQIRFAFFQRACHFIIEKYTNHITVYIILRDDVIMRLYILLAFYQKLDIFLYKASLQTIKNKVYKKHRH